MDKHLKLVSLLHIFTHHALVPTLTGQLVLGTMTSVTSVVQYVCLKMRSVQTWSLALFNPIMDPPNTLLWITPELSAQLSWWPPLKILQWVDLSNNHVLKYKSSPMPTSQDGVLIANPYRFMLCGHKEKNYSISTSWAYKAFRDHLTGKLPPTTLPRCTTFSNKEGLILQASFILQSTYGNGAYPIISASW